MAEWSGEFLAVTVMGLLLFAAWCDIATRLIPDSVSIGLAAVGLAMRLQSGLTGAVVSICVALLLFILLALAYARGMLGGGDVKLAAAVAVGLPPDSIIRFIVVTSLAGGVVALLYLMLRFGVGRLPPRASRRGASLLRRVRSAEHWRIARRGSIPYGVAISSGGIWAVLAGRGGWW
jgi:prepilin peptidase CpaA